MSPYCPPLLRWRSSPLTDHQPSDSFPDTECPHSRCEANKRKVERTVNPVACDAIERAWVLTMKARSLCPTIDDSGIGKSCFESPPWYRARGESNTVHLSRPLTPEDVRDFNDAGQFINRSFVITMAAILEAFDIVPSRTPPDRNRKGGDHTQLTQWLRNRFAHGEWNYVATNPKHRETWELLVELFPRSAPKSPSFVMSINEILAPLKNGVLDYIRDCS
jgi:hypothetical protein